LTTEALGARQNFFMTGVGGYATFYSRHSTIPLSSSVGKHAPQGSLIASRSHQGVAQMTLPLGRFFGQDVVQKRLTMLKLAGSGALETLGRSAIALHFWHDALLFFPWGDNHHHLPSFHAWPLFNHPDFC